FGQQYSYLTRDMIDLVRGLVAGAAKLRRKARGNLVALALSSRDCRAPEAQQDNRGDLPEPGPGSRAGLLASSVGPG
ncbi:hypothetical protein, partial [uncultured Hyphomonas sp.]|uniref:hypothetical protein n=1 Tax=uncultured Hyphomonas sp. TaxID=225298 RepID=UPI002605D91B